MKAHQRLIREQRAADDADVDMFGRWWQGINLCLKTSDVREISYETAQSVIKKYEWLGKMSAISMFNYGIFFDGCCGGVVSYREDYAENLGVWDRYSWTGKILCLSRGACTHWSPIGTASRLIRKSMKLLPSKYEVITCTCDPDAGEIGTIYQACGFDHVGIWSKGGKISQIQTRHGHISSQRAKQLYGTRSKIALEAMGLEVKSSPRKVRYFGFRGPHAVVKKNRIKIANRLKPYPKRAEQVSSRDTVGTPGKAGGSSPAPLQILTLCGN